MRVKRAKLQNCRARASSRQNYSTVLGFLLAVTDFQSFSKSEKSQSHQSQSRVMRIPVFKISIQSNIEININKYIITIYEKLGHKVYHFDF